MNENNLEQPESKVYLYTTIIGLTMLALSILSFYLIVVPLYTIIPSVIASVLAVIYSKDIQDENKKTIFRIINIISICLSVFMFMFLIFILIIPSTY